jgi:hypothetical protein
MKKEKSGITNNEATFQMILGTIFCITQNHTKKNTFKIQLSCSISNHCQKM